MKIDKQLKTGENAEQYLTFLMGGEEFAISILKVKEIIEYETITTVPNTPAWICGVLNLRGSVVPVLDLGQKLGRTPCAISKLTCIVITEISVDGEAITMGIMADAVSQVVELSADDIEATPNFGTNLKTEYLQGLGRSGKKFCLILNIDRALSTSELLQMNDSFLEESAAPLEPSLEEVQPSA